jgi:hypothetical protein
MKLIFIVLFSLCFTACYEKKGHSSNPGQIEAQGGVDVGNMTSAAVPKTNASMSYPNSWNGSDDGKTLVIQNSSSSKIVASRADISDLASPNSNGLEKYLEEKYPDRNYELFELNGLKGVRAELVNTDFEKKSDIYLVSELQDFLHIQSDLKNTDSGFERGENIILTVKVKYQGVPVENSKTTTVNLEAYYSFINQTMNKKGAYSFLNDCFSYSDNACRGVSILFGNGHKTDLSVGNAGYDYGRIVELGSAEQIPLDSIYVDGEFLVAPQTKVSIADIYTTFTPKDQHADLDKVNLKEGYVYLIRTLNWPDEDLIIKVRVDALVPDKSVTLTYQKLVYVKPDVLQKQVDIINKNTLENEKPISDGEVTLHNRSTWNNYFYASFNFEYSTSGNMFITRNNWDLLFTNNCSGKPSLTVPYSAGSIGKAISFGNHDLSTIAKADFPDPSTFVRDCGTEIEVGHTYGVYHHRKSSADNEVSVIYAAVQVLDLAKDNSWIRLKFRRIQLERAVDFKK